MSYMGGWGVRLQGPRSCLSTKPLTSLPDPTPSPTVCQTLNLPHLPPRPPTLAINTDPKLLGWGEGDGEGRSPLVFHNNFFPEFGVF